MRIHPANESVDACVRNILDSSFTRIQKVACTCCQDGIAVSGILASFMRELSVSILISFLVLSLILFPLGGGDGNFQNNFGFGSWKEQPFHMKKEFPIKEPFHMKKEFPIQKPFHIKKEFDHTKIPFHRRHYFKPVVKFIDIYKPRSEASDVF